LALNSRIGRHAEEWITDQLSHSWHLFRIRVLGALVRFIMDAFSRMLETAERILYGVDEWLRFRSGESTAVSVAKALLAPLWGFVNGFIRFCLNLLIEPQINPIKHFPVVTVSHKILLPLTVPFAHVLAGPLGVAWANTVAPIIVLLVPGIFGFLVWELTENWRLYAANRPRDLGPVRVGHHGETMIKFMRPGFRSGTLPKLFARLRRAKRNANRSRHRKGINKHLAGLHRVEEHVRRFINRDLLLLLRNSRSWARRRVTTGAIRLATNRILAEVRCTELSENSLWLSFEEQSGWLVVDVRCRGWLDACEGQPRAALENALAGFYKLAGVDLVREQLEILGPADMVYEVDSEGLLVWPAGSSEDAARYLLDDWPRQRRENSLPQGLPVARFPAKEQLVFSRMPVSWDRWVAVWEAESSQAASRQRAIDGASLLT
jgi:hypothetical protein